MTQLRLIQHYSSPHIGFALFAVCMVTLLLSGCHSPQTPHSTLPWENSALVTESDTPEAVWNAMKAKLLNGKIDEAVQHFSIASVEQYRQTFKTMQSDEIAATMSKTIKKGVIEENTAQYYFEDIIDGETITFPVEFIKENGVWKILEF